MSEWCKRNDPTCVVEPEDPDKLEGPEVGELVLYHDKYNDSDVIARVYARSYVWAPNEHYTKWHGYRHYDWTVIEDRANGGRVVVDDVDLSPLTPGLKVQKG